MNLIIEPTCYRCGNLLSDFIGNVLIESDRYENGIDYTDPPESLTSLQLACKRCTKEMDQLSDWHTRYPISWELIYLKGTPEYYLGKVLRYVSGKDNHYKGSVQLADDLVDALISMMSTEEARRLMHAYFPEDYEGEGPRYTAFCEARKIGDFAED
jgi:hypothetical protein